MRDPLYSSRSRRTLISFKDIRNNKYHFETETQFDQKYFYVTHKVNGLKSILERFKRLPSGLYITNIRRIEFYLNKHLKCINDIKFLFWHNRLGHPGSVMMRRIINQLHGHEIENLKFSIKGAFPYLTCKKINNQIIKIKSG